MNKSTLVPREAMSDLDWLARNVHKWDKFGETLISKVGDQVVWSLPSSPPNADTFTKAEWLARRAELQNKPSWGKHGWPQIFQNEDGHWFGARAEWDFKAHISGGWKGDGVSLLRDDGEYLRSGTILGDWRDTLEKRPEQAIADIFREVTGENRHEEIFEPFVSVEDAKLTIMQSDGDVKHFGGIIGRRLPLEEDAATAKNCDQVVTINIKPDSTLIHQPRGRIKRITTSKYTKAIHGVSVDVYDVLQAWGVSNPALQHLIKKALQCGQRGHKDNAQDLQDIIESAIRAKELES